MGYDCYWLGNRNKRNENNSNILYGIEWSEVGNEDVVEGNSTTIHFTFSFLMDCNIRLKRRKVKGEERNGWEKLKVGSLFLYKNT